MKPCTHCGVLCALRYRIQYRAQDGGDHRWHLVCPSCQQLLGDRNPHYRYGGTWKAKR
jgi:hypothetical protein